MIDSGHREKEQFFGAAKTVAALTLLSRVGGMLRDMAIVWLGAARQNDAFQFAFAIPNLFRRLFGEGALSAAFVPVFTETSESDGFEKARRLLANAMGLLAVFLLALMVLMMASLWIWSAYSPNRPDRQFLVLLTNIMLPFMVLMCLLALGSAALNCRGHFAYPAAAPIIMNVCVIVAAWAIAPYWKGDKPTQLTIISVSVTISGALQLAGVIWLLKRSGFSIRPRLWPIDPGVGRMLRLMAPMLLGIGFLQISSLFDYLVAWILTAQSSAPSIHLFGMEFHKPLTEGVLVRVAAAQRLYQFPMGVLAISLGTAVFPLMSRYASRGDVPNLRDTFNRALRLSIMEGLATGVGLFLLAGPIVKLIYRHGEFSTADAENAAFILKMYALGMWAFCSYQIVLRAFYSMKDSKTPLKISCALAVFYMAGVLGLVWAKPIGAGAFGLVPAITFSANIVILTLLLRRKIGRIGGRKLLVSVARSAAASAVMAVVVTAIKWRLAGTPNWIVVLAAVAGGVATFVAAVWLTRAPELGELLQSMRRAEVQQTGMDKSGVL